MLARMAPDSDCMLIDPRLHVDAPFNCMLIDPPLHAEGPPSIACCWPTFNCLQVLLRSLPAPPVQRRLYFNTIVACRRRLAKRWEQTPVAKLFMLEDEWSMLLQRAQAVRVGTEAIGRGEACIRSLRRPDTSSHRYACARRSCSAACSCTTRS